MWTLLNTSIEENQEPTVKNVVLLSSSTTLVANWRAECTLKWLKGRVVDRRRHLWRLASGRRIFSEDVFSADARGRVCESSLTKRFGYIERFTRKVRVSWSFCDEAHRLKNGRNVDEPSVSENGV